MPKSFEVKFMSAHRDDGKGNTQFLTENIGRLLFRFAMPTILSMLVAEMYNMVDSLFVGQVIGAKGIGALTIAFPVQRLFFAVSMLVAIGASTAVARSLGENDHAKTSSVIPNAFIVLTSIIVFLTALIFMSRNSLLVKLGASETIFPYAKAYVSIILIGVLFQGLTVLMSYILTSFGNAKINLTSNSIGAACNFIIDYVLVVVFGFGVEGAAIATVISQIIAFAYALLKFMQCKKQMNLKFNAKLDETIAKQIIFVGFSTFVVEISDAVVAVILNKILVQAGGDAAIVAVGLINRISMFLFVTVIGISSAMQPIAAYNHGACNYERVKEIVKLSIKSVVISSVALWAISMVFTKQFIGVFVSDKEIISYTASAFRTVISVFPCVGMYYVAIYYYQAMGMVKESFFLSIFRQMIVFIPLAYVLAYGLNFGVMGVWLAYPVSDVASLIISIVYIKHCEVEDMAEHVVKKKTAVATA